MRPSVELLQNGDGTWSVYVYGQCVFTGCYEDAEARYDQEGQS